MKKITITYKAINDSTQDDWFKYDGYILSMYPVDEMEFETDLEKQYEHTFYSENDEAVIDFILDNIVADKIAILRHNVTHISAEEWDEIQERL